MFYEFITYSCIKLQSGALIPLWHGSYDFCPTISRTVHCRETIFLAVSGYAMRWQHWWSKFEKACWNLVGWKQTLNLLVLWSVVKSASSTVDQVHMVKGSIRVALKILKLILFIYLSKYLDTESPGLPLWNLVFQRSHGIFFLQSIN